MRLDLYRRQGVGEYWIVDPVEDAVEVWTFGEDARRERFTDALSVRAAGEVVGEIDLADVFARQA